MFQAVCAPGNAMRPFAHPVRAALNAWRVPAGEIVACETNPVQFENVVAAGIVPFSTVMSRYGSSAEAAVVE